MTTWVILWVILWVIRVGDGGALVLAAVLLALSVLLAAGGHAGPPAAGLRSSARVGRAPGRPATGAPAAPVVATTVAPALARSASSAVTTDQVAAAMVLLAVALQSGCGVVEAMEEVARVGGDAAAGELAVVAAALRWGVADHDAWSVVDPRWARTELSLRLAARSGVAPSALLLDGADDLWAARLADLEVGAARVAVRLVLPLGAAFLPAFVLTTVVPVVLALTRELLAT